MVRSKTFKRFMKKLTYVSERGWKHSYILAVAGFVVAQGAPLGYLLHSFLFAPLDPKFAIHLTLLWQQQFSALFYIWAGTSYFFALFGFWIGLILNALQDRAVESEQSLRLLHHFDETKRHMLSKLALDWQTPISTTIEFLNDLRSGVHGPIKNDQKIMAEASLSELHRLHTLFQDPFATLGFDSNSNVRPMSVTELTRAVRAKTHTGELIRLERQDAEIVVDSELFVSALARIIEHLRQNFTREHIRVHIATEPGLTKQLDELFVYIVVEAEASKRVDEESPGWQLPKKIIEWHGGQIWQEKRGEASLNINIAIPRATNQKVVA